ncbi:MAG: bifunctional demethylmenaquinone methyltransferase/2-methoxy-6-polyprenyl-1,4-benzoquinol methylase [Zetaproteobacteria bacterium CG12_big_fil_rev_8_21_14_0_65_55_1124]|nr:MAG: bifunctional demethylmenaquinone methyltransferase/2-methoxy-6-polyprenyl-1,4-benzoquinol methylase [Zetaproteobacteria bacterium CG1_02_55_237]PIS18856.1 MAG: bifunctional demethylmenaquinone methyltransferase/2-methoxy-6-polyprenyl-1,4-benzoquinol methylase [Zetaproteobacteria bacterium CG08_land_8_20_14_0_20_55_17]PIW42773.1 MAG: bifunctional demethylmenaquinone methyltransferase/2-methoxy-6-polyprenyl-1,4-benzoquinol methylase [Zetaproteobacteria bacterium CG12_big_fil_rev_8_21_14_0_6
MEGVTVDSKHANDASAERTHFGFETVSGVEKRSRVMGVFSSVAAKYDLMNDLMSGGMHRLWKRRMFDVAALRPDSRVLDVAAGSGDIAIGFLRKMGPEGRVVLTDLTGPMLAEGARRVVDQGLLPGRADCIQSDGTKLPFADNSFDVVSIAFGIRNFVDVEAGLAEFFRVLKPGGQFICLEFSRPALPLLDVIYDAYSFNMIPLMGELVTGDRASYQYLVESIRRFPDQKRFTKLIEWAGFGLVRYENMTGGVVALHRGYKIA